MSDEASGYLLTETAEADFWEARNWSMQSWGSDLTTDYFQDLHNAAEYVASNHKSLARKDYLTGTTGLGIYAAREHYLIYVPLSDEQIAIVALIRQGRDIPAILRNNSYAIRKEVEQLQRG